jgi:hypothetical protein
VQKEAATTMITELEFNGNHTTYADSNFKRLYENGLAELGVSPPPGLDMHTSSAASFTLVEYDKWKLYAAGFFFDMECVEHIAADVVIDNTGLPHATKDIILEYSWLLLRDATACRTCGCCLYAFVIMVLAGMTSIPHSKDLEDKEPSMILTFILVIWLVCTVLAALCNLMTVATLLIAASSFQLSVDACKHDVAAHNIIGVWSTMSSFFHPVILANLTSVLVNMLVLGRALSLEAIVTIFDKYTYLTFPFKVIVEIVTLFRMVILSFVYLWFFAELVMFFISASFIFSIAYLPLTFYAILNAMFYTFLAFMFASCGSVFFPETADNMMMVFTWPLPTPTCYFEHKPFHEGVYLSVMLALFLISPLIVWGNLLALTVYSGGDSAAFARDSYSFAFGEFNRLDFDLSFSMLKIPDIQWEDLDDLWALLHMDLYLGMDDFVRMAEQFTGLALILSMTRFIITIAVGILHLCHCIPGSDLFSMRILEEWVPPQVVKVQNDNQRQNKKDQKKLDEMASINCMHMTSPTQSGVV